MTALAQPPLVDVVIPAHDAVETVGAVVAEIPARARRSVVVVDHGSTDATGQAAADAGAVVLRVARRGYGAACRRAVDHLAALPRPADVVVFMAADGRDDPAQLAALVAPLAAGDAELAIGVRAGEGPRVAGLVARRLIRAIYGHEFASMGRFRAIRLPALVALAVTDVGDGYHAEMQVKAVRFGLDIIEVPVTLRATGVSPLPVVSRARAAAATTTRTLFHIVRHATTR